MKKLGLVVFLLCAVSAFAGTANVSTGLDASGHLITTDGGFDAHWLVQQASGQFTPAQVVMPQDPDWFGGWLPNGPNSAPHRTASPLLSIYSTPRMPPSQVGGLSMMEGPCL